MGSVGNPAEQMLAELKNEGRLDSQGRFTLNPSRAREMLARFQLESPAHIILHLVSHAVAQFAQTIRVDSGRGELRLEHDGSHLGYEVLENPLGALLSDHRDQVAPRELAIALNTLLAEADNQVEILSGGWALSLSQQSQEFRPVPVSETTNRLVVRSKLSLLEPKTLEALRYCPAHLVVDGQTVSAPFDGGTCAGWLQIRGRIDRPGSWLKVEPGPADFFQQTSLELPLSAFFRLGGGSSGRLLVIYLGRLYELPLGWGLEGLDLPLDVVVSTDRLRRDLSHTSLLQDRRFENLQNLLKRELTRFLSNLARHCPVPSPEAGAESLPLVEWLVGSLSRGGQRERAYQLQMALCRWWRERNSSLELGRAWFRLALLAKGLGREEESLALTSRAVSCWHALGTKIHLGSGLGEVPRDDYLELLRLEAFQDLFGTVDQAAAEHLFQKSAAAGHHPVTARAGKLVLGHQVEPAPETLLLSARACFESGRKEEALALFRHLCASSLGQAEKAEAHEKLAILLAESSRLPEARDHLILAVSALKRWRGEDWSGLAPTLARLARVLEKMGEKREAHRLLAWVARL